MSTSDQDDIEANKKVLNDANINSTEQIDATKITKIPSSENIQSNSFCIKLFEKSFIKSFFIIKNKLLNKIIIFFVTSISCWLLAYLFFGTNALPGGIFFSLIVLVVSSHVFGFIFEKIKMPSLLGKYTNLTNKIDF